MSVLDRLRALFAGAPAPDATRAGAAPPAAPAQPDARPGAPEAPTPLASLRSLMASSLSDAELEPRALDLFERAVSAGPEPAALEAARAITRARALPGLSTRLADRLIARGDLDGALVVLEPLLVPSARDAPLEAWMLGAELVERRGEPARALALYERVLSRDFAHPRARERALRLRDARAAPRTLEGATLLGGNATGRRFRILAELGRGGAGTVFLADEPALGRKVALKVYHRHGRADRERLIHEARVAAALEHPGVVRVLDVDEPLHAIAMEPLEDGSVKAALGRGAAGAERARAWAAAAADALAFVHARGVVHCDLKPSNFLLRGERMVVLTDFGIARRVGERPGDAGEGSLGYMPPEQQAGAPADFAMDVHALGVSMREMLGEAAPAALRRLVEACVRPSAAERPSLEAVRRALG